MSKLIVGNLKMNLLTVAERDRYFESFKKELKGKKLSQSAVVLCPPAVHVEAFAKKLKTNSVSIGAQNIFWEERGSYTGEISAAMVKNFGAEFIIAGHSERRRYFGETNAQINAKMKSALKSGLSVILCVGETKEEKAQGKTSDVIVQQIRECLADIPVTKMSKVVIAYEPVWAVGSDVVPASNEIMQAKILIKKTLMVLHSIDCAEKVLILYGGSVKAKTAQQVCVQPEMDGALIGRESLIPREFIEIAEIIDKQK
jgi:triosephosphate isomerase (TIM)